MDAWPYAPQKDISESLEWLTDVQRCKSREYRQALRLSKPRQELQLRHLLTPSQFGQAKVLAKALGADSLFVPLWPWFTLPGPIAQGSTKIPKDTNDPSALTKNGSSVMLWESSDKYEVHTVTTNSMDPGDPNITLGEAVGQAFTAPVLLPLRVGQFVQEFEVTRATNQNVDCSARFRIQSSDDYSQEVGALYSSDTYADSNGAIHAVVLDPSLATSGIREQFERRYEEIDSVIGGAYRYPTLTAPEQSGQITWSAQTRAGMRALLYWLHSRKGKWKSFWVPSWSKDITVTSEIAALDTSIEISDVGIRSKATFPLYLMVVTTVGTRVFCRVTGGTAGSAGKESLTLSAAFGQHLYTWEIAKVCILTLSRFDSDRIEVNYRSGGYMTATAPTCEATE
jgi:hypothetical protein